MTIHKAIRDYLLASTAVTSLIGDRIRPQMIQQGETLPAMDMRLVATSTESHLAGLVGLQSGEMIFDIVSDTPDQAHEVYQAVLDSGIFEFKGSQSGVDIRSVLHGMGPTDFNDGVYPGTDKYRYGVTFSMLLVWCI